MRKSFAFAPKAIIKNDGMSMDFIGTPRKKKTPKYYLILRG
jgi:hypothetical protein